jgi:hypothetical protein
MGVVYGLVVSRTCTTALSTRAGCSLKSDDATSIGIPSDEPEPRDPSFPASLLPFVLSAVAKGASKPQFLIDTLAIRNASNRLKAHGGEQF